MLYAHSDSLDGGSYSKKRALPLQNCGCTPIARMRGRPPDEARPASRAVRGGRGRDRVRSAGAPRSRGSLAPRWDARAALAWKWTLLEVASATAVPRRQVTLDVLRSAEARESFVQEARKRAPAEVVAAMADVLAHHAAVVAAKLAAGQDIQRAVSSMEDVVRRHHGNVAEPADMGIPLTDETPARRFRMAVKASTRAGGLRTGSRPVQRDGGQDPPRPLRSDRTPAPRLKATLAALGPPLNGVLLYTYGCMCLKDRNTLISTNIES